MEMTATDQCPVEHSLVPESDHVWNPDPAVVILRFCFWDCDPPILILRSRFCDHDNDADGFIADSIGTNGDENCEHEKSISL